MSVGIVAGSFDRLALTSFFFPPILDRFFHAFSLLVNPLLSSVSLVSLFPSEKATLGARQDAPVKSCRLAIVP